MRTILARAGRISENRFNSDPRRNAASAALFLALTAGAGHAQDEILVTATKTPLRAEETGAHVSVIDAADIERRQYSFVADALADATGLQIARNGGPGAQAAMRIRGEASGRTLVVIDGVVANDPAAPGGGFDFSALDAADIERIEILRGPYSVLYGSEAIGGVVAITTKRGAGEPAANLFAEGGSHGTARGGGGVYGGRGAVDYGLSASAMRTGGISRAEARDGNSERDGFTSASTSARLGADFAENLRLDTSLRYQWSSSEIDGFPPPDFSFADTDEEERTESLTASGRLAWTTFDGALEQTATLGYRHIDRRSFDGETPTFEAEGARLSAEYLAQIVLADPLTLLAGAAFENERTDADGVDDDATTKSVFALAVARPFSSATLTAGLRHDDHETFGGATTGRVTGAYEIADAGLVLRASWGEGFAAPSLFQLNFVCCGGAEPNRALQPETSTGWEAGFDKDFGENATLRATWFRQRSENLIDFDFTTGAYVNIASTMRKGVEAELNLTPLRDLDVTVGYAFIDAQNLVTNAPLLRQPKHAAFIAADWRLAERASIGGSLRYNGEEADVGGDIDSFTRVDLRAAFVARPGVEVYARMENLFDTHYQDVLGYGEPGRSVFGGVRARL